MQNQYSHIKIENIIYSQGVWSFQSNGEVGTVFRSKERLEVLFNGSLHVYENSRTAQNSGPVLFTVSPLL